MTVLFLLCVSVSCLNNIHDEDAWMHLSLGRLIWELKALPGGEMFMYPYLDKPFFYTSWLFGLVYYLIYHLFDVYGLVLFKSVIATLAFFIMLRDSLQPRSNHPVAVMVLMLALFLSYGRIVSRPELMVMVFLPLSVYCLNAFYLDGRKYVYALPLVHLIWANSHTSIPLMAAVFLSYLIGGFLQRYLRGELKDAAPSNVRLGTVALIFALSTAASLLNPLATGQYTYGAGILSADWNRSFVEELLPPIGGQRVIIYGVNAIVALSFLLNARRLRLYHLFLVLPLMAMPFISVRFKLYLALISGPVVARNLSAYFGNRKAEALLKGKAAHAVAAACLVILAALMLLSPQALGLEKRRFGFGFDHSKMPFGAVRHMDENDVTGRVLNSYHFGQYIIWTGYPERTVYVDGRAALTEELLQKLTEFRTSNAVLDELYGSYGFEIILIEYPFIVYDDTGNHASGVAGRRYVPLSHPLWAPVYWDDISILYLRRGGRYGGIIERDEYRYITPDMDVRRTIEQLQNTEIVSAVKEELQRNMQETGSSRAHALMGMHHGLGGRHKEAIDLFNLASPLNDPDYEYAVLVFTGDAYSGLGETDKALESYEKSLALRRNPAILLDAGRIRLSRGDLKKAAEYLTEAIEKDDTLLEAYPLLIDSYRRLGLPKEAEAIEYQYMTKFKER